MTFSGHADRPSFPATRLQIMAVLPDRRAKARLPDIRQLDNTMLTRHAWSGLAECQHFGIALRAPDYCVRRYSEEKAMLYDSGNLF
jgi:hypothetical protein